MKMMILRSCNNTVVKHVDIFTSFYWQDWMVNFWAINLFYTLLISLFNCLINLILISQFETNYYKIIFAQASIHFKHKEAHVWRRKLAFQN